MKKTCHLLLFVILLFFLSSCYDAQASFKHYPWYRAATWHCEEIDMTIEFELDESGNRRGSTFGQFTINNTTYTVEIGFHTNAVGFLADQDNDGIYEIGLDGTWFYRQENLVIEVHEDNLFDNQFTNLVFVPISDN